MIPTLIGLLLSPASAQIPQPYECSTYEPCLEQNDIYVASTCQPMTNATMSAICMCYANANRNNCFLQCPTDTNVQTAAAAFQSTLIASCAAVNLNPRALPPAPWVTFRPTASATNTGTSSSGSGTGTGTDGSKKPVTTVITTGNSGSALTNIGIAFVAFMAMFFAI